MPQFRTPNKKQRITLIGRTGSGKTTAAVWHLSRANFNQQPWIIVDFKTDELINSIPNAEYIGVGEIPKHPGIYIVQPDLESMPELADMLEKIRVKENIGVYVDEGYMMNENALVSKRFGKLLTQGRSKNIPMIVLSQRPVWLTRFVFSESEFFQIFHLQDRRDVQTIEEVLPPGKFIRVPDYHSIYFDVGNNEVTYLAPVPSNKIILESIEDKFAEYKSLRRKFL